MPRTSADIHPNLSENQNIYHLRRRPIEGKNILIKRLKHSIREDQPKCRLETSVKDLPFELIIEILSYLDIRNLCSNVAPVCKKMFIYANEPVLWRRLTFQDNKIQTSDALSLLRHAKLLKKLEIINQTDKNILLQEVCQSNRFLEHIVIKCSIFSHDRRLTRFAVNFSTNPSNFEWSSIESIFDDIAVPFPKTNINCSSKINSNLLLSLLRACPRLKSIKLIGVEIRSRIFARELAKLKRLQSVDVTVSNHKGNIGWDLILQIRDQIGEGTRSEPLYLHGIYYWCERDNTNLSRWIFRESNMAFIIGNQNLIASIVVLNLDASILSEDMAEKILTCTSLKALHISNALTISAGLVVKFLTSFEHLESLMINQAYSLQSAILLSTLHEGLSNRSEQKKIKLKYFGMNNCPALDDASLLALIAYFPQVEHLSFAQCEKVTDEGLCCILWFCHYIRSLNFWGCSNLLGNSFAKIPLFSHKLKLLMIGDKNTTGFKDKMKEDRVTSLKYLMPSLKVHYSVFPPKGWIKFCEHHES